MSGCGVLAYQQYSVVVAVREASLGSKINNVCGVWPLVGGDVIAEGRGKGLRTAKLEVSADRVT